MLQQTQVKTVVPYFDRFMRRFPDIASLARAPEQDVLRLWEGLGYYRRARAIHQAAKVVVNEFGGVFPSTAKDVQSLPGIGRYTAGAILSIAYDLREPILEANSIRLYCRLLAYRGDASRREGQKLLWLFAESLLPRKQVGIFNQALMELGSQICSPRDPNCHACPIGGQCRAFQEGRQEEIPLANQKMQYEDRREAAMVVTRRGRVLLRRCTSNERWAGLWDFPRFQIQSQSAAALWRELGQKTKQLTGIQIRRGKQITTIHHGVTRYRIRLECYNAIYVERCSHRRNSEQRWVAPAKLDDYPLNATGRKITQLLEEVDRR